jgi:hypothetical protein
VEGVGAGWHPKRAAQAWNAGNPRFRGLTSSGTELAGPMPGRRRTGSCGPWIRWWILVLDRLVLRDSCRVEGASPGGAACMGGGGRLAGGGWGAAVGLSPAAAAYRYGTVTVWP